MHLTERWRSVCRAGACRRWVCVFTPDGVGVCVFVHVCVIVCLRYPAGTLDALCLSTVRLCVHLPLTENLCVHERTHARACLCTAQ